MSNVLPVVDVFAGPSIPIPFCQTEVNAINLVAMASDSHEEVIGFDIAMDEALVMDVFDAGNHLVGQK